MKTSSPTTPKPADPQTILLVGPPGGGKTSLILRFDSVCIVDIDMRLDGAEQHSRAINPALEYGYLTPTIDDKGKPIPHDKVFEQIRKDVYEACQSKYSWVAIDGLTALNYHLIAWVSERKVKNKGDMEQSDWIPFRQELLRILNAVKLSGKNYILTAHEETMTDREGKIVKRNLLLDSKLREAVGGWFSNVWRCSASPGPGGKANYHVNTRPSGFDDLKASSTKIPPEFTLTSPTFNFKDHVLAYL